MLTLRDVSYCYAGASRDCLHAVSLDMPAGRVTGLVGPAGAGKSTLCLIAAGLAPRVIGGRLIGEVRLDGENIASWPMHRLAERVTCGLQDPAGQLSLVADTVFDEVAFGPANLGLRREEILERASAAMRQIGIESLAGRDPRLLSGGQQQLVVLAGLMAMRPRVLVLDEPAAHLDARGTREVLDAVVGLAGTGTAVLLAEQRTSVLASVADSLALVAGGNIVAHGTVREVLDDPTTAALGVEPLPEQRLRTRLRAAGLDPALLDAAPLHATRQDQAALEPPV